MILAAVSLVFSAGCKQPSFGNEISDPQIRQVANEAGGQIEAVYPAVTDAVALKREPAVAAAIVAEVKKLYPDQSITVTVISADRTNAFAIPGGRIYIDSGMLAVTSSDTDALAALIAHEAAHAVLHHSMKRLIDAYGVEYLEDMLIQGKYQEVGEIVEQIDMLPHDKDDELHAEQVAITIMRNAGYNPRGLLRLFYLATTKGADNMPSVWSVTHPISAERVKHAEQLLRDR